MVKYMCEMVLNNRCLGCVGLGEKDWVGKYNCSIYKKLKGKKSDDNKNSVISTFQKK